MQARGHRTHDSGDLGPWGQRHLLLRRIRDLNLKVLLEPKELMNSAPGQPGWTSMALKLWGSGSTWCLASQESEA